MEIYMETCSKKYVKGINLKDNLLKKRFRKHYGKKGLDIINTPLAI